MCTTIEFLQRTSKFEVTEFEGLGGQKFLAIEAPNWNGVVSEIFAMLRNKRRGKRQILKDLTLMFSEILISNNTDQSIFIFTNWPLNKVENVFKDAFTPHVEEDSVPTYPYEFDEYYSPVDTDDSWNEDSWIDE